LNNDLWRAATLLPRTKTRLPRLEIRRYVNFTLADVAFALVLTFLVAFASTRLGASARTKAAITVS
jgi:hypothetical protein